MILCLVATQAACSSEVECGAGTELRGHTCVSASQDAAASVDAQDVTVAADALEESLDAPHDEVDPDAPAADRSTPDADVDAPIARDVAADALVDVTSDLPPLASTDTLIVDSVASTYRGGVLCLRPSVLHADGSRTALTHDSGAFSMEGADTIAAIAARDDCPATGVIGLAAGRAAARIVYVQGGTRVTAPLALEVSDCGLTWLSRSTGWTVGYHEVVDATMVSFRVDGTRPGCSTARAQPLPRALSFEVDAPSVVSLSPFDRGRVDVRAAAPGMANVIGVYAISGVTIRSPVLGINVRARTPADEVSGATIRLLDDAGRGVPFGAGVLVAPATCFTAELFGVVGTPPSRFVVLYDDAVWTSTSAALTSAPPGRNHFCTRADGEVTLTVTTPGGTRGAASFTVLDPASIRGLTATIGAPGPFLSYTRRGYTFCVPFSVTLSRSDGSMRDVTTLPTTQYETTSTSSETPALFPDFFNDSVCPAGQHAMRTSTMPLAVESTARLTARYAGRTATVDARLTP